MIEIFVHGEHQRAHHNHKRQLSVLRSIRALLVSLSLLCATTNFNEMTVGSFVLMRSTAQRRIPNYGFLSSVLQSRKRRILRSAASSTTAAATTATLTTKSSHQNNTEPWNVVCDLQLPEGRCVVLDFKNSFWTTEALLDSTNASWIHSVLHAKEVDYALTISSMSTRQSYIAGRVALGKALDRERTEVAAGHPILKDEHGRPSMPMGYLGSISHKKTTGAGIVMTLEKDDQTNMSPLLGRGNPFKGVGVDIEVTSRSKRSVAKRILTTREMDDLGKIPGVTKDEDVLLRFSLKECLYKAVHPLVCQYIGFQEAEVFPHSNGTATVVWNLTSGAHEKIGEATAHWRRIGGENGIDEYFLSTGSVTLQEDAMGVAS